MQNNIKNKQLSNDELLLLIKLTRIGDEKSRNEAREKILENSKAIILSLIHNLKENPFEKEDLFAVGLEAVNKAIDTFDFSKEVKFTTYVYHLITNELKRYFKKNKKKIETVSLDEYNDDGLPKLGSIACTKKSPESELIDQETKREISELIDYLLSQLSDRNAEIMRRLFNLNDSIGIYDGEHKSVAIDFNLSHQRIYQIESSNLKKMRKVLEKQHKYTKYFKKETKKTQNIFEKYPSALYPIIDILTSIEREIYFYKVGLIDGKTHSNEEVLKKFPNYSLRTFQSILNNTRKKIVELADTYDLSFLNNLDRHLKILSCETLENNTIDRELLELNNEKKEFIFETLKSEEFKALIEIYSTEDAIIIYLNSIGESNDVIAKFLGITTYKVEYRLHAFTNGLCNDPTFDLTDEHISSLQIS